MLDNSPYSCQRLGIPSAPANISDTILVDGWILIQQNMIENHDTFNRNWLDYKNGFDDNDGNYWFGNEKLFQLTSSSQWKLKIEMEADDTRRWYFAEYSSIQIASESDFFRIQVSGYSGTAGDAFNDDSWPPWMTNGQWFTTLDSDNDGYEGVNCASRAGWWFNNCGISVLNVGVWGTLAYRYDVSVNNNNEWSWKLSGCRMMIMKF